MSFDFDKAIKEAKEAANSPLVGAVILGCSGAGKSRAMGTFGVKTLYIYASGEDHGVQSAACNEGADIIPLCFDSDAGKALEPDAAYARLLSILDARDKIKALGVGAVVIDGVSELEALVRNTSMFTEACKTSAGKHNTFAEPAATVTLLRPIFNALKSLQRGLKIHFALSCILDVKALGNNGEIEEASPRLTGYSVAESVVQQFGDVLVVGRMERNGEIKYKFQFLSELSKTSKDDTGRIKRTMNFSPRVTGAMKVPPIMDADLKEVIKLKKGQK